MTAQPTSEARAAPTLPDLRARAVGGFLWSALENWGTRAIALATSLVLARLLSPELFGIASAVGLVLMLVPLIAELGFSDAIVQRRDLREEDLNLPFFLATGIGLAATATILLFSNEIAARLGIPEHRWFLVALACTVPLAVPLGFQDAVYRRRLRFRVLAVRGVVATVVGAMVGIGFALAGFGLWTFLAQALFGTLVTLVWLWWRPLWRPTLRFAPNTLLPLLRFGLPTLVQRLIDFAGTRLVDVIILTQAGLAAYGMFAIGARLYQTLLQALQGAFFKVTFALLSQIAHERARLANAYEETISVAACAISPAFVLLAALAPEISAMMFGAKWAGIEHIMRPLLLLGAVHGVQYMNGAFLSASGVPSKTLITGVTRSAMVIAALLTVPARGAEAITWIFVVASLAASPLSFQVATRQVGVSRRRIALAILVPWTLALAAFAAVETARPVISAIGLGPLGHGAMLGAVFGAVFAPLLWAFDRAGALRVRRLAGELLAPLAAPLENGKLS